MQIAITGADGTGKSTVAKRLSDEYGLLYFHLTQETPNDYDYYIDLLELPDDKVIDRFQLDEIIYSPLFERDSKISISDTLNIASHPDLVTIILYSSDVDKIEQRLIDRDGGMVEDFKVVKQANLMYQLYGKLFKDLGIECYMIDVETENVYEKIQKILRGDME